MPKIKWVKTANGYTATTGTGEYAAVRQPNGKFQAVIDGCDEYGIPESLSGVKDRCEALHEQRRVRNRTAARSAWRPGDPILY